MGSIMSFDPELSDVNNDGYVSGAISVTSVAIEAKVGASSLAGRESITVLNKGPNKIYYGPSGVTTTTGSILEKNQFLSMPLGNALALFLICASGESATAIIQEIS